MGSPVADLRDLLGRLAGEWVGHYRLWLEPGQLRSESTARGTIRPVLAGRFMSHDYEWSLDGEVQHGSMLIGCTAAGTVKVAWIDTWHNGDDILFCTGEGELSVTGTYGPADDPWQWRTEFALLSPDELVITAWNVTPTGAEAKATETVYRRTT